jgi:hypothetical protein
VVSDTLWRWSGARGEGTTHTGERRLIFGLPLSFRGGILHFAFALKAFCVLHNIRGMHFTF